MNVYLSKIMFNTPFEIKRDIVQALKLSETNLDFNETKLFTEWLVDNLMRFVVPAEKQWLLILHPSWILKVFKEEHTDRSLMEDHLHDNLRSTHNGQVVYN